MLADLGYDTFYRAEDIDALVHPARPYKREGQLREESGRQYFLRERENHNRSPKGTQEEPQL